MDNITIFLQLVKSLHRSKATIAINVCNFEATSKSHKQDISC